MSRDVDEPDDSEPPSPTERPDALRVTGAETIAVAALSGAAVGYLLAMGVDAAGWVPPTPPISLIIALAGAGVAAWVAAGRIRRRIRQGPIEPHVGVRAVVAGKSMLFTGAVLAGGHIVYAAVNVSRLEAPGPRGRFILSCVTLVASAFFAVAGSRLERACVVDDPQERS